MKLDLGMHIGLHLVFFGKTGVTEDDIVKIMQVEGAKCIIT
jgi:hypothetical protein